MSFHHFDAPGYVSIWVGVFPSEEVKERQLRERYGDRRDGEPLAEWMGEFGFGWFDHDFMDINADGLSIQPLRALLAPCSYARSLLEDALRAADAQGISEAQIVLLLHEFRYDPRVTGVTQGNYLQFLGAFPYSVGGSE
jgi:Immunity protein 22